MARFRTIDYGKMLYESVRAYYAVNSAGELSILYQVCAAIVQPLQGAFDAYHTFRQNASVIASCPWQIGQLTNVLNYLYDNVENRIFITQSVTSPVSATGFAYNAIINAEGFGGTAINMRGFYDTGDTTVVAINIPSSVNLAAITATIEQINLRGIPYQVVVTP
jgi:hypothetical protein